MVEATGRLRPWREVARPRPEIADGSFDESLFAADLGLVDRGRGPADYLDPVTFCEKTYLTDNLRAVLGELTARLSGDMAAAGVYRLQTEFGGGKTHTLLVAYHLFRDPARVAGTALVTELAKSLGRSAFPVAATSLTFVKELCTAVTTVPGAALVATLTSSNLEDYASVAGEDAAAPLERRRPHRGCRHAPSRATTSSRSCTAGCSCRSVPRMSAGPLRTPTPTGTSRAPGPRCSRLQPPDRPGHDRGDAAAGPRDPRAPRRLVAVEQERCDARRRRLPGHRQGQL